MNEHKAVPNIRFNGFKSNWEKIQLKNYVTWYKGSGLPKKYLNVKNIGAPVIHYSDLYKFSEVIKNVRHWSTINQGKLISNNSILFPSSDVTPNGLARTSALVKNGVKAGGDIIIGTLKTSLSNVFMSYQINRNYKDILRMVSGTTIRHIHATDLSNLSEYITYYPEQQKIGDFFTKLDKLLDLQQQKIDKLELLKKALLQKLFPKHDADIPELRFKGFNDEWKSYLLGKIAVFINGRAFKQNELLDKGKYPVLRVGNFYTNDKWFYSDLELPEKLYANKGDLLYTWSATFGPHIWKGDKVIYHYHIWKIIFSSEVSKQFALQMLLNDKEELMNNTNGSTMIHLTKNEMEKKVVKIPIKPEQQKIGNLLSKVDQLIELENKKLQNFQQVKKCLLKNMFVE